MAYSNASDIESEEYGTSYHASSSPTPTPETETGQIREILKDVPTMESPDSMETKQPNNMKTRSFERSILDPRCITIEDDVKTEDVWEHFGTSAPMCASGGSEAYRMIPALKDTRIWVPANDNFITSYFGSNVRKDSQYVQLGLTSNEKSGVASASLVWRTGGGFQASLRCGFILNLIIRSEMVCPVIDRMICPYLTAEIRQNATDADGTGSLEAMHRMVSSAAMAVYNRYKPRKNLMPATSYNGERPWAAEDRADMKHYRLLMAGVEYSFWVIEAKFKYFGGTTAGWEGCSTRRSVRGRLDIEPQAKIFAEWLDEIHRWGLTVHASEVQYDINVCIGLLEKTVRPGKKRKREGVSGTCDDGGPATTRRSG